MTDLYPRRGRMHPACSGTGLGTGDEIPKDRGQLTPDDPEDAEHLAAHRGQGTAGTGQDLLPEPAGSGGTAQEAAEGEGNDEEPLG